MKALDMTAEQILSISTPERLFNKDAIANEFLKLRKKWHPDYCSLSQCGDVFHRINVLKEQADKKLEEGTWDRDAEIRFTVKSKTYRFAYLKFHEIDGGKMYIGTEKVLFVIDESYKDLYDSALRMIDRFPYRDAKLKKEFEKFMPNKIVFRGESDIGLILVLSKPKNAILLRDVMDHVGNIDPKHVAWIGSSLFNLAVLFEVCGICHNGITSSTVFIDPEMHSVHLLGGWWFAVRTGEKVKAVPKKMSRILPKSLFDEKVSKTRYDSIEIKATLIEALGDRSMNGSSLLKGTNVPSNILSWLRSNVSSIKDTAIDRYTSWYSELESAFGKRKFINFDIKPTDIYGR